MANSKKVRGVELTGERLEIYRRNHRIKLLILSLPLVAIVVAYSWHANDIHAAANLVGKVLVATIVLHIFFVIYTLVGRETPQYLRLRELATQQRGFHGK